MADRQALPCPGPRREFVARSTGALLCLALLALSPPIAHAKGIEDSFSSELRVVRPAVSGLDTEVTQGDRMLRLRNGTGQTVIVKGYDDEPYLRFLANEVVQVNVRSPSKYTNEDRFALRPVPSTADSGAPPKWQDVARNGTYEWFEHRIHWMERTVPSQVKDRDKRTKVFDWDVPMDVGNRPVHALGTLFWDPGGSDSGFPVGLAIGLGAAALAIGAATLLLLRRRTGATAPAPSGAAPGAPAPKEKEGKEAW
jgi:hypothetical protein